MSTIFRSMVGAAALVAASSAGASASFYTWTLENFRFGDFFDYSTNNYEGTESNATASGNFVLKDVEGGYELVSYNFTTTPDTMLLGEEVIVVGTGFAGSYATNSWFASSDGFDTFFQMSGPATDIESEDSYTFRLTWDNAALFGEMGYEDGAGFLGALVPLVGVDSYEVNDLATFKRVNDGSFATTADEYPGGLRLTAVTTPEPASLALLGTGLLGIFVARRRKAA